MSSLISFFSRKLRFSNFWVRNGLIWVVVSIVANHLLEPENFPLNESYRFPWLPITISIFLGSLITAIAYFNFQYFRRKYFIEKINAQILSRFLFTTLGYISIVYIIVFYAINGVESHNFYALLVGFCITILLCIIGITFSFAKDIYKLYRFTSIEGKLKITYSGKITLVSFDEIAFAYSENKIAFIVKTDGTAIPTDFTLNEIQQKINEHSFYRANRQTILHACSIEQVESAENGKLSVLLKPALSGKQPVQITISRYKKQGFMDWFENKS